MLFSTPLKRVVHSWNMLTITFCAHRNLLIAFAISPDLCIAGSAIYFGILCLHLTPGICLRFPNSGEIWASAKLVLPHIGVPGTLFWPHWRPPYHSTIHYFVVEHFHCQCPSKLKLRGCRLLPCSGSALDWICFRHGANERELSSGPPFCMPNLLKSNGIVPSVVDVIHPMLGGLPQAMWLKITNQSHRSNFVIFHFTPI